MSHLGYLHSPLDLYTIWKLYICVICTVHGIVISIEYLASAEFLSFYWLVLVFRESYSRIVYGLAEFKTSNFIVCFQIFSTQNYILFKISASGLFFNYS